MTESRESVRFYLGANTPGGFVAYLEDLYDPHDGWRAYIIKSGPGTGKASLMRAVLKAMTDRGLEAEAIHCSSDPGSLDAVLVPSIKACIIDGTAPHAAVAFRQKKRACWPASVFSENAAGFQPWQRSSSLRSSSRRASSKKPGSSIRARRTSSKVFRNSGDRSSSDMPIR